MSGGVFTGPWISACTHWNFENRAVLDTSTFIIYPSNQKSEKHFSRKRIWFSGTMKRAYNTLKTLKNVKE